MGLMYEVDARQDRLVALAANYVKREMIYLAFAAITHLPETPQADSLLHVRAVAANDPDGYINRYVAKLVGLIASQRQEILTLAEHDAELSQGSPDDSQLDATSVLYTDLARRLAPTFLLPGWFSASEQDFAQAKDRMTSFLIATITA